MTNELASKDVIKATSDLLEHLSQPLVLLDNNKCVQTMNPCAQTMHGIKSNDNLLQTDYLTLCSSKNIPCPITLNDNSLHLKTKPLAYKIDHSIHYIQWALTGVTGETNQAKEYLLIGKDVTTEIKEQDNLIFLKSLINKVIGSDVVEHQTIIAYATAIVHYLESIIHQMPGSVYWKDDKGHYLGGNKYAADLVGLDHPSELFGKRDEDFATQLGWTKEITDAFIKDDLDILQGKCILNREEPPFKTAGNKVIHQLTNRVPLHDIKGNIVGILGCSIDITDRKLAKQLQREKEAMAFAEKEKTSQELIEKLRALSANLSHAMKTPLTCMQLGIEQFEALLQTWHKEHTAQALQENPSPSLVNEAQITKGITLAHKLEKNIQASVELLDMQLSNIKMDKVDTHSFTQCNIEKNITQALADYPFKHTEESKVVHFDIQNSFNYWGKESLTQFVLWNLINNALYAIREAGRDNILITCRIINGKQEVSVLDNGIGMTPEIAEEIFKPFYTLRDDGAGLGLPFCQLVMHAYKGAISYQTHYNKGTEFILTFPEYKNPQQPPSIII